MKIKSKSLSKIAAGIAATFALGGTALAQSSDALIDKLVEKGILSVKEANDLREEADKGFNMAYSVKSGMPEWVTALKFNGDFRGRYDGVYQDDKNYGPKAPPAANAYASSDRTRFRYRLRFGAVASLSDNFEVGLRLGSGELNAAAPTLGANVFSANQTIGNDASRKLIFIDLAYAKWTPKPWFEAQIGKMASAFWITDAILDPDYNPEGAQEKFTWEIGTDHKVTLSSGQFVIAENFSAPGTAVNNDVYLFVNQLDWTAKWTKKLSTRVGVAAINFKNQRSVSGALETFINQNGTPAVGVGSQNFNPIIARGEVTYALESFPLFTGEFPITLGGEYVNNPAADDQFFLGKTYGGAANQAYNLGVQFGSAKAKGNWQLSYNYKNIESAATWHGLNDDDFGFNAKGGTDVRGHQIIASYHAFNPFFFNIRYMITEQIANLPNTKSEQQRMFVDLLWQF